MFYNNKDNRCRNYNEWNENGPFGRWFGRSFAGGFGGARFERGELKYVILDLLKDKSRHGYDIIQELEKKFHGFYSPSPGSVYPILQLLEDQEFVISNHQSGKKVYTITQEGEAFLKEHAEEIKDMHSRVRPPWEHKHNPQIQDLKEEIRKTAYMVFNHITQGAFRDPEKMKKLHEAFRHFRSEIEAIFSENEQYAEK